MAEEAKDSPTKGRVPPCEYPDGALDLLKKLTEGKPPTRATGGWLSWEQIVNEMNEHFEPVNKIYHPKFTYEILQTKAVAEGWYTPAAPTNPLGLGLRATVSKSNPFHYLLDVLVAMVAFVKLSGRKRAPVRARARKMRREGARASDAREARESRSRQITPNHAKPFVGNQSEDVEQRSVRLRWHSGRRGAPERGDRGTGRRARLLGEMITRLDNLVEPLDLDEEIQPSDDHHQHVRDRHRARVVVVAFDLRSLLLRAFDRLLEDLIHIRPGLRAFLLGRKAKDGFGDRMLLRTARGALAGGRVFVVAFRDPSGARLRHLAAIDTLSPSLSLCGDWRCDASPKSFHFFSFY